jgi:hypothetical protein
MKKLTTLLLVTAVMLFVWDSFAPTHAQDPASEEKPTFYRLIPGVYVNGWPRFTMTYPKDWVEQPPVPSQLFGVKTPGSTPGVILGIYPWGSSIPLDKYADIVVLWFKTTTDKDVTVVSNKPSQLRDGTPAREVELKMVRNGEPYNWLGVGTKKGDVVINTNVGSFKGKIGEDLKAILYSLQYESGKDEPVKQPPDIQEFFKKFNSDVVSHDLAKVMTHYSDRYLHSGRKKREIEWLWRQVIGATMLHEVGITDLVAEGDKVYLAGFFINNGEKHVMQEGSIIKESGEWKWYGNQRDVAR